MTKPAHFAGRPVSEGTATGLLYIADAGPLRQFGNGQPGEHARLRVDRRQDRVGGADPPGHRCPRGLHQRGIRRDEGGHADDVRLGVPACHVEPFGQIMAFRGDGGESITDLLSRRISRRARVGHV